MRIATCLSLGGDDEATRLRNATGRNSGRVAARGTSSKARPDAAGQRATWPHRKRSITECSSQGVPIGYARFEWIEGRNIQIEYLFAGANLALINQQVAELIRSAPDAIVAKSTPVLAALRTATSTTPLDRLDRALHRFSRIGFGTFGRTSLVSQANNSQPLMTALRVRW